MRFPAAFHALIILMACLSLGSAGAAGDRQAAQAADAESLDRAIDDVLQRRVFQWRMPREFETGASDEQPGAIASFFNWLDDSLLKPLWGWVSAGAEYVAGLLRKLIEWLDSLIPRRTHRPAKGSSGWMTTVRLMLIISLLLLAGGLLYGISRLLKRKQPRKVDSTASAETASPDLAEEGVCADELPAERWLGMARELIANNDLRLATRALYLATLAHLAARGLITVEFFKSNLEYKHELDRRAREKSDLRAAFSNSISSFERVWYGLKPVTRTEIEEYAALQEKIIGFAES